MRYRKKPVEIEAYQLTSESLKWRGGWPQWLQDAENKSTIYFFYGGGIQGLAAQINTLEGVMNCAMNDWIIQGVNGELYPCKPDIFEKTYEPVERSD